MIVTINRGIHTLQGEGNSNNSKAQVAKQIGGNHIKGYSQLGEFDVGYVRNKFTGGITK